ncbi:MAG: hypothetical protein FWH14_08550 [Oscillospiraceae bacterium]|nr:hypothetical protein [Oscillospiraceae bacterium]
MQAIQGVYDNGVLLLDKKAPAVKSRVIVLFTENETRKKMSKDEALKILHKHAGSIKREVDFEKERDEYLSEKYGCVD